MIDRVIAGERITVTRDGKAVAELRPLSRQRLSASTLVERFKRLPAIDLDQFRADIDSVVDQSL
ncbi:MAG: type II toxin-antitoxin system Phd/YefM family antitoxin [Acidimicrobiales bacterium]